MLVGSAANFFVYFKIDVVLVLVCLFKHPLKVGLTALKCKTLRLSLFSLSFKLTSLVYQAIEGFEFEKGDPRVPVLLVAIELYWQLIKLGIRVVVELFY